MKACLVELKNQMVLGDCLLELAKLPAESMDQGCTDPPYGYSFMGKDWDHAVPPVAVWKECLRVLKPGAFMFVMSSPRADVLSQMIVRLGEAGFRTDFTPLYWCYASGFPKSENISLQIDKRACWGELTLKLGRAPTKLCKRYSRFVVDVQAEKLCLQPKCVIAGKACEYFFDEFKEAWAVFRPSIGSRHRNVKPFDDANGWNQNDTSDYRYTKAVTLKAYELYGAFGGFQPKPAVEVILVCMKPLGEKNYVIQALANRKGVTWLDEARIPFASENDVKETETKNAHLKFGSGPRENKIYDEDNRARSEQGDYSADKGRFPANLLVSDDILNDGTMCGGQGHFSKKPNNKETLYQGGWKPTFQREEAYLTDQGSFSRYFSLDAWFESKIKTLPVEVQQTFPFLIQPKASASERNKGLEKLPNKERRSYMSNANGTAETWHPIDNLSGKQRDRFKVISHNIHPCVKPLQLMCYLVTLGSRPGDLVFDPYGGSGTTALACKMMDRYFWLCEKEQAYYELLIKRVAALKTLFEFRKEKNSLPIKP